ncbi:MAG: type VII secretion protein EccB [Hamadaea sp.]|uniref:type VII secretion protein EccB n=1 Tax=Hamadaea sp. TaxID=2024425 RepID=UPI0017A7FAE5|nr:type VII secretion protein EccB [Hamadaea sp.]NUR73285.1 type VII secretion protein EccB [Hamadaea sp.]NUT19395.1 type VII secretion protein EccB [Hamadaea sp.]
MPSRQDQLHSYQFSVQRVVSALVMRETDPAQFPFRRVTVAGFASLMIGVVLIAGFGVYALFTGGASDSWKQKDGAVLQEKGTGAHYVLRDGVLHPTLNLASALLYAGGNSRSVIEVSAKSLATVPRGPMVGIPDAPDSVPTADRLVNSTWTVCTLPVADAAPDESGQRSLLAVGNLLGVADGGTALTEETGMAVSVPGDDDAWLIWRQRRFLVKNVSAEALSALGINQDPKQLPKVDRAFLNAFQQGDPIQAPAVSGTPRDPSGVGSYLVGDVLRFPGTASDRYFVVSKDNLQEITQVQAALIAPLVSPPTIQELPKNLGKSLVPQGDGAPPAKPVKGIDRGDAAMCATAADDSGFTSVRYGVPVPPVEGLMRTAGKSAKTSAPLADYVSVQGGRGVLVEGYTVAKTSSGVVSLVTDAGQQFPLGDEGALAPLGFTGVTTSKMPVSLVALLPQGPELSKTAASTPVTLG